MKSPRQEWYDEESDPSPGEPRVHMGRNFRVGSTAVPSRDIFGGQIHFDPIGAGAIKPGEIVHKDGQPIGVVQAVHIDRSRQIGTADVMLYSSGAIIRNGRRLGSSLHQAIITFNHDVKAVTNFLAKFGIMPETPKEETKRERALRLKKEPHWQAQDPHDFHFDHRGRRRY